MTICNNHVNLCDSCKKLMPECEASYDDVIYGDGVGNDNICACNKYQPVARRKMTNGERFRKVFGFRPSGTTLLYCIDDNSSSSREIRWEDPFEGEPA